MKNLFREKLEEPKTEGEEKWQIATFFSTAFLLMALLTPLMALAGQLREVDQLSINWFVIMGGMIAWPLSVLFTLNFWITLFNNFGFMMYYSGGKNRKKKALNSDNSTEDKK